MTSRLTWQAVVLLAVLGGVAVGLSFATSWDSSEIIALVGVLAGIAGGAVAGGAAAQSVGTKVDAIHAETTAQTETIATIERRTNGELDARIAAAMTAAREAGAQDGAERGAAMVLRELAAQGIITPPAADRPPPARWLFGSDSEVPR